MPQSRATTSTTSRSTGAAAPASIGGSWRKMPTSMATNNTDEPYATTRLLRSVFMGHFIIGAGRAAYALWFPYTGPPRMGQVGSLTHEAGCQTIEQWFILRTDVRRLRAIGSGVGSIGDASRSCGPRPRCFEN